MSKILIIEDDLMYRKIYKKKFEVSGYTVEVAEDGALGFEKMRTFRPDLVFLDIMMPKMDGFQVLEQAQADPELRHIPIVITTNLSSSFDSEKLIQKGAKKVIVKSDADPSALIDEAVAILGDSTPQRQTQLP